MQIKIKRLAAYFFDIMIISIVASLISNISFINPKIKEYQKDYNNYVEVVQKYQDKKITTKNYQNKLQNYAYYLEKDAVITTTITVALTILYFVFFQWWKNGQTFGKKFMRLKVESANNKKLSLEKYLIRSVVLYNILFKIADIMVICLASKDKYITVNNILYNVEMGVTLVLMLSILINKEGRGLHDLIANTKVTEIPLENTDNVEKEKAPKNTQEKKTKVATFKETKNTKNTKKKPTTKKEKK